MINRYAKLTDSDIVDSVIICEDSQISTLNGNFVKVTTETNEPFSGFPYNKEKNKFQQGPQPYPSWILNENTLIWESPVGSRPEGESFYKWNEETLSWESMS